MADSPNWLWLGRALAPIVGIAIVVTVGAKAGGLAATILVGLMVVGVYIGRGKQRWQLNPLRDLLDIKPVEAETPFLSGSTRLSGYVSGQPVSFVVEGCEDRSEFRIAIPCDVPAYVLVSGAGEL